MLFFLPFIIMTCPLLCLFVRFKEHLNNNPPKDVLSSEEYEELKTLCRQSQKAERAEQAQEVDEERPPGEEQPATPEGADSVSDTHKTNIITVLVKIDIHINKMCFFTQTRDLTANLFNFKYWKTISPQIQSFNDLFQLELHTLVKCKFNSKEQKSILLCLGGTNSENKGTGVTS